MMRRAFETVAMDRLDRIGEAPMPHFQPHRSPGFRGAPKDWHLSLLALAGLWASLSLRWLGKEGSSWGGAVSDLSLLHPL